MFDTVAQDILHNCSSNMTRYNPCITGATMLAHVHVFHFGACIHIYMYMYVKKVTSDEMRLQKEYQSAMLQKNSD